MSKQNIINSNGREINSQQRENNSYITDKFTNNFKLTSIDNENNGAEIKTIPPQKEIELLKKNLIDNKYITCINNDKNTKTEEENLDKSLNPYIMANKSKEHKILELLEIINQYESQISSLNNQIISLTNRNKQMKEIIKNIELEYEQTKVNLMTEKEVNKNNNKYLNDLYQDKVISEKKIKELIEIIKQYSNQTEELTKALNHAKKENINVKKENEEYKNNNFKLNEKNNSLEYDNKILHNDCKKINEEILKLKEDNKKLIELQFNMENKMKTNLELHEKIKLQIKKEENKNSSLIQAINQDLNSLAKYFELKYNKLFDEERSNIIIDNNYEIETKLTLICFQNCDENNKNKDINIRLLIKTLINGFNNSKEKIKELKNKNININEKLSSLINKEKDYNQQIEDLKKSLLDKEKLVAQFNNEIIKLKKEINDNYKNNNINRFNNTLILEKKIEILNNEIKLKEIQIENANKLIKIKDDNIYKLKEDNKKLIQDNINLIKERKNIKKNKK